MRLYGAPRTFMENQPRSITIEIVYALRERQFSTTVNVPADASIAEAIAQTKFPEQLGLARDQLQYAVFGRVVAETHTLRNGDRIELLRPLGRDVKETRRRLAREGRSVGKTKRDADQSGGS
jgi:uncharacterized protein